MLLFITKLNNMHLRQHMGLNGNTDKMDQKVMAFS